MLPESLGVGWLFAWKATYFLSLVSGLLIWGNLSLEHFHQVNARWPREGEPVFASHFATWDGAHYLLLSEQGYAKDVPSCAFYPLWPLVMRATAPLFGGNPLVGGLVLSNLASLAAWVMFYRLVERRWGKRSALWALVFLIVFPGSLFFQFIYSESLFLLLLMGLWWALEERRHGWAAVCAGLLPLCRGVGAFVVLPLAWHALSVAPPGWLKCGPSGGEGREDAKEDERRGGEPGGQDWAPWLLVGMPLLGWGVYLALMWHWTGNPFEGFAAQKHWAVHSVANLWNVPKFVIGFFSPTEWHAFRGSLLDRCIFVLLLYTLPVLWRLDKGLLVWAYVLGILPAMSGTFTSFVRFASCTFPMFIALGVVLNRRKWRWWRYGLLASFAALHLVLVWRFVNFRWAG
ncbi:MAG: hypothetical protein D6766_07680 [Verrucomicrobia bacterium]|nr:MAG: hypothetical protein D6766_07680 [Verrucomicrobiota bacterium]